MTDPLSSNPALAAALDSAVSSYTSGQDQAAFGLSFSQVVDDYSDFDYNLAYRMLRNV